MNNIFFYIVALLIGILSSASLALSPETMLSPEQEAKARLMFYEIRCVVCDGESIADSKAEVAIDMRRHIRQELHAGKPAYVIRDELVARYGEQILMTPPLKSSTWLLWFGPLTFVMVAFWLVARFFSHMQRQNK